MSEEIAVEVINPTFLIVQTTPHSLKTAIFNMIFIQSIRKATDYMTTYVFLHLLGKYHPGIRGGLTSGS